MKLTPLHDPKDGKLRVAGLMSGSGSNLRKIIGHERELNNPPYEVCCIFSDDSTSKAAEIGAEFGLPVIYRDVFAFYKARDKPIKDMKVREEFDIETARVLDLYGAQCAAFAGYMRIATEKLTKSFISVNVHPGDLSVVDGNVRKYTGDNAVEKALRDGAKELRSSTILLESAVTEGKINSSKVDCGKIFMISQPLEVRLDADVGMMEKSTLKKAIDEHQSKLKEAGDWKIFPLTLQYIAEGRYARDEKNNLYFDGKLIPSGIKL
jgi:folate-dependent phosphoribosylglycinamide formyltransferase PurN